jgi:hypothetical protein
MPDFQPVAPPPSSPPTGLLASMMGKGTDFVANLFSTRQASMIKTSKSNPDRTKLLDGFKQFKKECFADRWIWERQHTRILHYLNSR